MSGEKSACRPILRHRAIAAVIGVAIAIFSTVAIAAPPAKITVPVTENGNSIGTITINNAGNGVTGNFTGTQNLADLAQSLNEDHFNWFQVCTPQNDFLGVNGGTSFIDPMSGGQGTQWSDALPWYWDETAAPSPLPMGYDAYNKAFQLSNETNGDTLGYTDTPSSAGNNTLSFTTILMSIGPGNNYKPLAGFTWTATVGGGGTNITALSSGATFTNNFANLINSSNFGQWTQVPEPSSPIVLLGMLFFAAALIRVRPAPRRNLL